MGDLISRGEAKRKLAYVLKSYGMEHVKNRIFDALNRCKAVDAASVVRCKDCKHWNVSTDKTVTWCSKLSDKETIEYDFCSFGEKVGGDEDDG